MNATKRVGLVTGAIALTLTGSALANNAEANDQDLRERIAQMEKELAQLQSQNGNEWMTEQRATEIRSIVQDVLQDADTRASLLQGGMESGWDGGFYLASADGGFRLNVGGQMQVRYMYNLQDEDSALDGDTNRGGFENTRTKLVFSGNVFNDDWTYKIEGNFSRFGGHFLQDGWINYDMGEGLGGNMGIRVGQYKGPFAREFLIDSSQQQVIERSLVTGAFSTGRMQGIMFHWNNDDFRWAASFNDGLRSANSPSLGLDTEWSFSGRVEWKAAGDWSQFEDFQSWNDEEFALLVGGAVHYQSTEYGTAATGETDTLLLTADAQAEFGGANLFGAVYYADFDSDAGGLDINPFGFVLQGGYMFQEDWEVFGRFEYGDSDIDGSDDLLILTAGVTRFWDGNNLKWSADIGYSFDQVDAFWGGGALFGGGGADIAGYRQDADDEDGQLVFRTQLQLLF